MGKCVHEDRIIDIIKATEANTANINNLTYSVNKMQKWLIGFVISVLLLVVGVGVTNYISPTRAIAKEIIKKNTLSNDKL